MSAALHDTLDHLFRRESGRLVAYLTRFFGPNHLDLAESVVQTALLKALQTWPTQGIPENPSAWILKAAKNEAIDQIRKRRDLAVEPEQLELLSEEMVHEEAASAAFEGELVDDQLKLLFICCHPALSREARLALTLKTVCGFSVKEIARAFLGNEDAISQRILRAKKTVAELGLKYEVPGPAEIAERVDSVLEVIYLLFNEGYSATEGELLIRRDLCEEAIFRASALSDHLQGRVPKVHALLALMHFHCSRFDARTDGSGNVLLLEEQDRTLWDQSHIHLGAIHLERSASGEDLSEYHLQAGIASCHALSPDFASTPWDRILNFYDLLSMRDHSPVVALNRAVALAMVEGPLKGIEEVEKIRHLPPFKRYYLVPATLGELSFRAGKNEAALTYFEQALELAGTEPERRQIQKRIRTLKS